MKPCRHGHPLSDRYRSRNGHLQCKSCRRSVTAARKAKAPVWTRVLARRCESAYRRRKDAFWRAWLALGELRNETSLPSG